jgi:hypothetical protein
MAGLSLGNRFSTGSKLSVGQGFSQGSGLYFNRLSVPPALSLVFAGATSLDSRITFSRPSLATMYDSTGKLTYAPNNVIFPSTPSADASWGAITGATLSPSQSDPFGGTTSVLMRETTDNSQHSVGGGGVTSWSGSTPFVYSIYIQQFGSGRFPQLQIQDQSSNAYQVTFDPPAGLSQITFSGGLYTNKFFGVQSLGSGWYRLYIGGSAPSGTTGFRILFLSASSYAGTNTFVGNTSNGFYLVGAQVEAVTYETTPRTYNATTASAYYGPRFDYNPSTLAARGLLIEEARTNLFLQSGAGTNAAWATGNVTPTISGTSIQGTSTLSLLSKTSLDTATAYHQQGPFTVASGATVTHWRILKAGNNASPAMSIYDTAHHQAVFNLSGSGSVSDVESGVTASCTSLGNSFYLCSMTYTITGTSVYGTLWISGRNGVNGVSGDSVYFDVGQLEAGAFATSYIPTGSSSVARSADVATMTGTNFSSWYNATEGTFKVSGDDPAIQTRPLLSVDDSTAAEQQKIYSFGTDTEYLVIDNSAPVVSIGGNDIVADVASVYTAAYKVNDFAFVINSVNVRTENTGTIPTVTLMRIGSDQAGNYLDGHIQSIYYYNQRLTNSQMGTPVVPIPTLVIYDRFDSAVEDRAEQYIEMRA